MAQLSLFIRMCIVKDSCNRPALLKEKHKHRYINQQNQIKLSYLTSIYSWYEKLMTHKPIISQKHKIHIKLNLKVYELLIDVFKHMVLWK